ncbi:uncharacterized protein FFNC_15645 [Fusarium fujikuroi]|nr:uncharacterized protein FFNC_15645 [Fusarium fujikuroi]
MKTFLTSSENVSVADVM